MWTKHDWYWITVVLIFSGLLWIGLGVVVAWVAR
jgi:hypothetical protein